MSTSQTRRVAVALAIAGVLALPAHGSGADGVPVLANPGNSTISDVLPPSVIPGYLEVLVEDDRNDEGDLYSASFSRHTFFNDLLPRPGVAVVVRPGLQYGAVGTAAATLFCGYEFGCAARVVAYHEEIADTHVLRANRSDGISWDVEVTGDGQSPSDLSIVADGGAGVWVCWLSNVTGEVRYQHLDGYGNRLLAPEGEVLTPVGEMGFGPKIAIDGSGGFFASWLAQPTEGGALGIRAQRIASNGAAAPGWPTAGVMVRALVSGSMGDPVMAPSPGLGVYIAWSEDSGLLELGASAVTRLVRIQPDATVWPAFAGSIAYVMGRAAQDIQAIAPDGQGGVVAAVLCAFDGVGNYVVQRIGPDGARPSGWPAEGVRVSLPPAGTQQRSGRIIGTHGGLYAVWQEDVPGADGGDIVATHLSANGALAPGWSPQGTIVGGGTVHQYDPFLLHDESDGAMIVWGQDVASGPLGVEVYGNVVNAAAQLDVTPAPVPRPTEVSLVVTSANPSRGGFRFSLALPTAAEVQMDVLDVAGRRIEQLAAERLPAGRPAFAWTSHEVPGLYFVRARVDGRSFSVPVTITR